MSRPDDDGDNGNAADDGEDGMRVQTASDEPSAEAAFKGEIASVNFIATCLRGLFNGKRDQRVEVTLTPGEGMHMTVTDSSKSIQGIASVGANVFDIFETKDDAEEVCFRVNLAILLDCLTMCSGPTRLRLCYNQNEETIALQLNEGDAITECNIRTMSDGDDDSFDFTSAFRACEHVNKGIVQSERLRDAFLEVDDIAGASTVRISMGPSAPFFRLSCLGQASSCDVDFADSTFILYQCESEMSFEYRLPLLRLAVKPLADAEKTFIKINSQGMLSIQHLIRIDAQKTCALLRWTKLTRLRYVEFFLLASCDMPVDEAEEA